MAKRHDRRTSKPLNLRSSRANAPTAFDRETELPKLIGLWPAELRDYSLGGTARIVALLSKALRAERRRGAGGHWAYDLNRHMALSAALKVEEARLAVLARQERSVKGKICKGSRNGSSACGLARTGAGAKLIGDADRQRHVVAQHLVDGTAVVG
jgi:hypothetical protein